MKRNALGAVLVAALVIVAGCSAAPGGSPTGTEGMPGTDGETGTVDFYLSDQPNAIGDFEHLNVTITKVGLHEAGAGDDSPEESANATDGDGNETDGEADGGNGDWVEYDVNATADLTRLVGDNASRLDSLSAPAGSYDKVFVYVEEINATLENGEQVNVKLPSEKLHIKKGFEVGSGSNVSFVFDIAVKKAGGSGKYILQPIVSQSGSDVPIRDVDREQRRDGQPEDRGEREQARDRADDENESTVDVGEDGNETRATELAASFEGPVAAGENATLQVTADGGPVANATVAVDGDVVGVTDADGTVTIEVAADAKELEVRVTKGEANVELEWELERSGEGQGENPALAPPA